MLLARFRNSLLAATLMLSALVASAQAQTSSGSRITASQILPRDTYLFLNITSVADLKSQAVQSAIGQMIADPAMDNFRNSIVGAVGGQVAEGAANIQAALGMSAEELLSIPTGEMTVAFSKAPPNRMGVVLYMDYGDHEAQLKSLLDKALPVLQNSPVLEAADVEHDGTTITMFKNTSESAQATPLAKEFGWFLKDSRMVVSNSSALLKLALDNWDGTAEKTFAKNESWNYILEKTETKPGNGIATVYFDPIGLFTQLVQTGSLGEAGLQAGMAISVFPMLGLNQLKGLGGTIELNPEGYESSQQLMIFAEQPPTMLMQMFQLSDVEKTPPSWVKENVTSWTATHWKVEEAYKTVEMMVDMFQGPGSLARMIDEASERDPGIHVKEDIIDQLDGRVQLVSATGNASNIAEANDILIAVGCKDTAKMTQLLTTVAATPGFPAVERDINGTKVYELELGAGAGKISLTAANNMLLVGIGGGQLEMAIRDTSDVRPLAETPAFQAVAKHFPENARLVGFSRPSESVRSMYDMLKKGDVAESFPGMDEVLSLVDFAALPEFEKVAKYLTPGGSYWVGDENGIILKAFSLEIAQ